MDRGSINSQRLRCPVFESKEPPWWRLQRFADQLSWIDKNVKVAHDPRSQHLVEDIRMDVLVHRILLTQMDKPGGNGLPLFFENVDELEPLNFTFILILLPRGLTARAACADLLYCVFLVLSTVEAKANAFRSVNRHIPIWIDSQELRRAIPTVAGVHVLCEF